MSREKLNLDRLFNVLFFCIFPSPPTPHRLFPNYGSDFRWNSVGTSYLARPLRTGEIYSGRGPRRYLPQLEHSKQPPSSLSLLF